MGSFRRGSSPDAAELAQSRARGTPRPSPGLFSCWATRTGPWPQGSPAPLCSGHPLSWGHTKHSLGLVLWMPSNTPCYLSLILGWPDDQPRCRFSYLFWRGHLHGDRQRATQIANREKGFKIWQRFQLLKFILSWAQVHCEVAALSCHPPTAHLVHGGPARPGSNPCSSAPPANILEDLHLDCFCMSNLVYFIIIDLCSLPEIQPFEWALLLVLIV